LFDTVPYLSNELVDPLWGYAELSSRFASADGWLEGILPVDTELGPLLAIQFGDELLHVRLLQHLVAGLPRSRFGIPRPDCGRGGVVVHAVFLSEAALLLVHQTPDSRFSNVTIRHCSFSDSPDDVGSAERMIPTSWSIRVWLWEILSRGVTISFEARFGGMWLGLSILAAIAIGACSVGLDEAQTIHDDGVAMAEDGEWEDAAAAFSQVIDLEPRDTDLLARAYVNRSVALGELGRVEEALADDTAAIDLQPGDVDLLAQAYVNRAADLVALARVEEALTDATAAIDLQPGDTDILAQAYLNRSFALFQLGRTDEAAADLQTVLGLLPPTHELNRLATEILADPVFSE